MQDITIRRQRIGRIKREGWVDIDACLLWKDREVTTVDHQTVVGYWQLSVSATLWARSDSSDCYAAGQVIEDVRKISAARDLCNVWERWHLNDLRAGCMHQTPVYRPDGGYDLDAVPSCTETGYRFGHARLVEIIPDSELGRIASVLAALPRFTT